MKLSFLSIVWACLLLASQPAAADGPKPQHISNQARIEIIRTFNSDLVYVRTAFPMGMRGLSLKDGKISPDAAHLQEAITLWGPAVKPGQQAMISAVTFQNNQIRFEINGGPIKKKKWYQHITISGADSEIPLDQGDSTNNPHGSYVDLVFDNYIPEITPDQMKKVLSPVFDFDSKSALQAYLETVPPIAKDAIQKHHVLVGMNHEMVIYAKGRPPRKTREKEGDDDYEEWIYGDPPEDVDFVRFMGEYVVRVETMKVNGEKTIHTAKEVDLEAPAAVAKDDSAARPAGAPSLRRPGEASDPEVPTHSSPTQPTNVPMGQPEPPGTGSPTPPQ